MQTAEAVPQTRLDAHPPEPSSTTVALLALLIALALMVGVTQALSRSDDSQVARSPEEAVRESAAAYLDAWERSDFQAMNRLSLPGTPDLTSAHAQLLGELHVLDVRAEVTDVIVQGPQAEAAFASTLVLDGLGSWTYRGSIALHELAADDDPGADEGSADASGPNAAALDTGWRVAWDPTAVHPALGDGRKLARIRTWPERASLLAFDGSPLTGPGGPDLPVLAAQVVGRVGPASPERAQELGQPYLEGDVVGLSGLQAGLERRLAGRPSGQVVVLDRDGQHVQELAFIEGRNAAAVHTTIDLRMQAAAEAALGPGRQAALVAVHAPTGQIRAVVSRPAGGFNRAFQGQYPPGSTFKVATAYALLTGGLTPDDVVQCPASTVVSGRRVGNAQGEELGPIPFRTAFFRSCNTAFVGLTHERLDPLALSAAAEALGFNADPGLPVPAAGGSFPMPESEVELVAAAIGQARVTASPLHMATMAGAIASGAWRPPSLTVGPTPPDPLDGGADADPEAGSEVGSEASLRPAVRPLDPAAVATLQELMRLVVAEGTGTAARLPGEPVAGKTGTAEFGTRTPPRTHAWFIGFRGEVAFAVVVEDAGFGGAVAAPIAAAFLSAL